MKALFWGYVDYDEKIHVKLYKNEIAIRNAQDSGTTIAIVDPFLAESFQDAEEKIVEKWRSDRVFIKKEVN